MSAFAVGLNIVTSGFSIAPESLKAHAFKVKIVQNYRSSKIESCAFYIDVKVKFEYKIIYKQLMQLELTH